MGKQNDPKRVAVRVTVKESLGVAERLPPFLTQGETDVRNSI